MKGLKTLTFSIFVSVIMGSFSQCSGTKILQEKAPIHIDQVYCQKWIAGVEGGGSGLNIYIPVEAGIPELDSVYFRGKVVKLKIAEKGALYIGRFMSSLNQKKDIIMSNEPNAEYGNQAPEILQKFPFVLKETECVISYQKNGKTLYFKIKDIIEKELIAYPSTPPNKQ
jgi:hypothetical protein